MLIESSSALYEEFFFTGFSDPASPAPGVIGARQISGFGTVSSEIQYDQPAAHSGPFVYQAQSQITVDPATGISFSGLASVSFNATDLVGLDARASTGGGFVDEALISVPGLNGVRAFLSVPLHISGAVSTLGADLVVPFQHVGQLTYEFDSTTGCSFILGPCPKGTVGLSTPSETIAGPFAIDQTITVNVPFILGEPFTFDAQFGVNAEIAMPFDPSAPPTGGLTTADFVHTVTFGPATVLDNNGAAISGAIVLSDFNYLAEPNPPTGVPEPATLALLAIGLAGLAASCRPKLN
jgi:hypothetical protein